MAFAGRWWHCGATIRCPNLLTALAGRWRWGSACSWLLLLLCRCSRRSSLFYWLFVAIRLVAAKVVDTLIGVVGSFLAIISWCLGHTHIAAGGEIGFGDAWHWCW